MILYRHLFRQFNEFSAPRLIALIALVYLVLGEFGLLLAIEPGYASPIFPAAGLALACVLWFGRRALPGIWLGSLILNLSHGWLKGGLHASTAAVAVLIAFGTVFQALFGSFLVHRWQGIAWREIKHERDALVFLLLGGTVACLLSAGIGTTTLYLTGIIKQADLLYSWWSWYVGDTLGVLVFTPLIVQLLNPSREQYGATQHHYMILPLLLMVCLLWLVFYGTNLLVTKEYQSRFTADSKALSKSISDRLITHREVLTALRNFIEVTPDLDFRQFEQFTRITLQDNPDIFALSLNDLISHDHRNAYEEMVSGLSPLGKFQITERDNQKRLIRAAERPEYVAVRYIVPLATSKPAVGYDINSEPVRRAAIRQARLLKGMTVTAPVQLVQERKNRVGVLELLPVEGIFMHDNRRQEPRQIGFAVSVIKIDEMIEIATRGHLPAGLLFQLTDPRVSTENTLLYSSTADPAARNLLNRKDVWKAVLPIGDRNWLLSVSASEAYRQQYRPLLAWGVGAVAIVLTGLVQLLIIGITGRTGEVQRTNDAVNAYLDNLFSCANVSILVWDVNFRITRFSTAFELLTGKRTEEIAGNDISMLFPPDQAAISMKRIREVLRGEHWDAIEIPILHESGNVSTTLCNLATVFAEDGTTPVATIAQGYDITERKLSHLQLENLNTELSHSLRLLEQEMAERQKAEEALQSLNISLENRVAEEVRKNREKDSMLLHNEKLASIGQLAAGVAHEINNPIGFIMANLNTLKEYCRALKSFCLIMNEHLSENSRTVLQETRKQLDVDYILDDLTALLDESTEGAERVRRIVLDLKDFARSDSQEMQDADLNQLVQSTINIVRNELKYVAQISLQLGALPHIMCHPQQINQVISNLLVNAAHAIEQQGLITVRTFQEGHFAVLTISDTGKGIAPELLSRIFDPFFTTKEVGKGTGLGLSISYDIVKKHEGEISVMSEVGRGTTFVVKFPFDASSQ